MSAFARPTLRDCPRHGPVPAGKQDGVKFDSHFWKTFVRNRLTSVPEAPDAMTLFGDDPAVHAQFADHLAAEFPTATEGNGRVVEVWQPKPGRPDNPHFDNLTGCAVGASILGVRLPQVGEDAPVTRRRRPKRRGFSYPGKKP